MEDAAQPLLDDDSIRARRLYQLSLLDRVLDACSDRVDFLQRETQLARKAEQPRPTNGVWELAMERVGRTLRYTFALQNRIIEGKPAAPVSTVRRSAAVLDRREQIAEVVENVIAAEGHRGEAAERMLDALDARLERPETFDMDRPFGAIVADLCKTLGITPDWEEWADQPWALKEILGHPPGSPYASWPRADLRLARPRLSARPGVPVEAPQPEPEPPVILTEAEWCEIFNADTIAQGITEAKFAEVVGRRGQDPPD